MVVGDLFKNLLASSIKFISENIVKLGHDTYMLCVIVLYNLPIQHTGMGYYNAYMPLSAHIQLLGPILGGNDSFLFLSIKRIPL